MNLALHTVICCCVLTTVLPLVQSATGDLNTGLKRRFRAWLQSRVKRDLPDSAVMPDDEECVDIDFGPEHDGYDANIVSPSSSDGLNIRRRRSPAGKGCHLVTCLYHDLVHRLVQISDTNRTMAPPEKMKSSGYGRRRRSLLDVTQLGLRTGRQRRSTELASMMIVCE